MDSLYELLAKNRGIDLDLSKPIYPYKKLKGYYNLNAVADEYDREILRARLEMAELCLSKAREYNLHHIASGAVELVRNEAQRQLDAAGKEHNG